MTPKTDENVRSKHFFPVPDKIPTELHPIMAAFMSYCLKTNGNNNNNARLAKTSESLIWKLLCFFHPEYETTKELYRRKFPPAIRIQKLLEEITKNNGEIMSVREQFAHFCDIASNSSNEVTCYLFNENTQTLIWKNEGPFQTSKDRGITLLQIPVIQLTDDKYSAVSRKINRIFGKHDLRKI